MSCVVSSRRSVITAQAHFSAAQHDGHLVRPVKWDSIKAWEFSHFCECRTSYQSDIGILRCAHVDNAFAMTKNCVSVCYLWDVARCRYNPLYKRMWVVGAQKVCPHEWGHLQRLCYIIWLLLVLTLCASWRQRSTRLQQCLQRLVSF